MVFEKLYGEINWKQWLDFKLGNCLNILSYFYYVFVKPKARIETPSQWVIFTTWTKIHVTTLTQSNIIDASKTNRDLLNQSL